MKTWKCPRCKKERETNNSTIMSTCYSCQIEMEVVGDDDKKI